MATYKGTGKDDNIEGSKDSDEIHGEAGNDTLMGHQGDDSLYGGEGTDRMYGGDGNDTLYGGRDKQGDELYGGSGSDTFYAGAGDTVYGGAETEKEARDGDVLHVESLDHIRKLRRDEEGNGYHGQIVLADGGIVNFFNIGTLVVNGVETPWQNYIVEGSEKSDQIDESYVGDPEGDKVDHEDNQNANNDDVIEAYGGDDEITSGDGNDTIYAGTGNDAVKAGEGDDTVYGEDGDDELHGNQGQDTLFGGLGNDRLYGGDGRDEIYGGDGDDHIYGGNDGDALFGGAGHDIIYGGKGNASDKIDGGDDSDTIYAGPGDSVSGGQGGKDFDTLDVSAFIPPGGYAAFDQSTLTSDTNSGGNGNGQDGVVNFYDANGDLAGTLSFEDIENFVGVAVCFTPGTRIDTKRGAALVETLQVGDQILTKDHGYQRIKWVGRKSLCHAELCAAPTLQPILIAKDALGPNLPDRDMMVSPQHRMLVGNAATQLWFGEDEVLVPAKHLTCLAGVEKLNLEKVEYIHFMFEHHEVVRSDNTWSESFQPGEMGLGSLDHGTRAELFRLFPELKEGECPKQYRSARHTLKRFEAPLAVMPPTLQSKPSPLHFDLGS